MWGAECHNYINEEAVGAGCTVIRGLLAGARQGLKALVCPAGGMPWALKPHCNYQAQIKDQGFQE